jgi:FAD/FMN-containing dehydrogenase
MRYQFSPLEMQMFRDIKKVFDPLDLLNPGKIF